MIEMTPTSFIHPTVCELQDVSNLKVTSRCRTRNMLQETMCLFLCGYFFIQKLNERLLLSTLVLVEHLNMIWPFKTIKCKTLNMPFYVFSSLACLTIGLTLLD